MTLETHNCKTKAEAETRAQELREVWADSDWTVGILPPVVAGAAWVVVVD